MYGYNLMTRMLEMNIEKDANHSITEIILYNNHGHLFLLRQKCAMLDPEEEVESILKLAGFNFHWLVHLAEHYGKFKEVQSAV